MKTRMIKEDLTARIGDVMYISLNGVFERNDLVLVDESALKYNLNFVDNVDFFNELDQLTNSYYFWTQKVKDEENDKLFISEGTKNNLLKYAPKKPFSRDFFTRLKHKNSFSKQESLRDKLLNEFEKKEKIFKIDSKNYPDYFQILEENKYIVERMKASKKNIPYSSIENILIGAYLSTEGKEVSILLSDYSVSDFLKQVIRGNRYESLSGYMRMSNDYFMKLI